MSNATLRAMAAPESDKASSSQAPLQAAVVDKDFIPFASNRRLLVVYDSGGLQNNKGRDTLIFRCSGKSGFSAEVSSHPQHIEARKLEREVDVHFTDVNTIVRTPEGAVFAHPGDAILTGNGGHKWRVSHGKFDHKYRPVPPTVAGRSGRYVSLPYHILAVQLRHPFHVLLADEVSQLSGQPGDWLVDYGDGSLGIVAHDIFATTYEIVS